MSRRALAKRINDEVNREMSYAPDEVVYGHPEWWADGLSSGIGDCEDFTLAKLHRLTKEGFPLDSMWFQTCITEDGQAHAVLRVRLEDGSDVVLDQRFSGIESPAELRSNGYHFISHIRADGKDGWRDSGG